MRSGSPRQTSGRFGAQTLRSEVARLEGLRARCERWIEWQLWTRCATPSEGTALLADLRAGRAG